jgi:hypothetical protein
LIFGLAFSKFFTSVVQYGPLMLLYCAMTTLIVPLALPAELLLLPPLLPPQAAASPTAATATAAPAGLAHRGPVPRQALRAPRLIDITKVPPGYPAAGQALLDRERLSGDI